MILITIDISIIHVKDVIFCRDMTLRAGMCSVNKNKNIKMINIKKISIIRHFASKKGVFSEVLCGETTEI